MCDFAGFKVPEMVKTRPVLVVGTKPQGHGLVTVVCLSTKKPQHMMPYHFELDSGHLPSAKFFSGKTTWVKADMIYTLSFSRFDLIRDGKDEKGKRKYFNQRLEQSFMNDIYKGVLSSFR